MTGGRETHHGSPNLSGPVVVDASVVVEFLVQLRWPAAAWRLFESLSEGGIEMVAPDLLYLEVTSAFRKLVSRGELEVRDAARAVTLLGQLPIRGLATQPLLADIWAWRDSLTPYDAAYAALAKSTGLPLVTADAGLATAARRRSIRAVTLEDLSG